MKTYVITLSRQFPKGHKEHPAPTGFVEAFYNSVLNMVIPCNICTHEQFCELPCICAVFPRTKITTIRANYELWRRRFENINDGKSQLSIRVWKGRPYMSKQVVICNLTRENGIGLQKITISYNCNIDGKKINYKEVAKNDGLSPRSFKQWFKSYDLALPMALIHFTDFRY